MQTAPSSRRRRALGLVAAFATVAVTVLAGSSAAHADEVYPVTSDGVLHLHGHGYGNGWGLSQWGAYGAASAPNSLSWPSILGFYYPNTTQTAIGNPILRVKVAQVSRNGIIQVMRTSTLRLSWTGNTGTWASVGSQFASATAWRIRATGSGTSVVEYYVSTSKAWTLYGATPKGRAVFDDPATGCGTAVPSGGTSCVTAQLSDGTQVRYRGQLWGIMSGLTLVPVLALPMEDYLRSVVPSESPATWPLEALKSQAVASRTYAENKRRAASSSSTSIYDICDSTACQVFSGTTRNGAPKEFDSSNTAVSKTTGTALSYGGAVIDAEFGASNGGWSADGGQPYLKAASDPYDVAKSDPYYSWNASIPASTIEATWPSIGTYVDLRITKRDGHGDWGGRVLSVTVDGSSTSVTMTGQQFQWALGLKTEWFVPYNPPSAPSFPRDVTGDGRADVLAVDSAGKLRIYPGNGSGGWQPTLVLGPGWDTLPKVFTAGTWDGDSVSDVMAQRADGTLWLYSGSGTGGLSAPRQIGSSWQVHDTVFATGDFNGDTWSDLLARRASDGALFLYAGNGQGGFLSSRQVGTGWGGFTALLSPGDFDGDGHPDVLARGADGRLWLYPGNGAGGWLGARVVGTGWNGFTSIVSPGDFDGDGFPDVLAVTADGTMRLYPGNGSGGWKTPTVVGSAWNTMSTILR